ncbi:MAG TPA: SRPBCC family protein [Saprospiraceae bacterium]|nr:SRPBCC family protein [Saprospiraceae bacterium]
MKLLKKILYVLLALIVLLLIIAFILPKKYEVSVSKEYNVPVELAFNAVNDMKLQEKWNPWKKMDPEMKIMYGDTTVGAGASYSWEGPVSKKGTFKYLTSERNKEIGTEVIFEGMGDAHGKYIFDKTEGGCKITWTFEGESSIPMNLMNFLAEKYITKDFNSGLENLGELLNDRKSGKYLGYEIKEVIVPAKNYVMNRAEVKFENIAQFYAQNLGSLFQKLQTAGIEMAGMPCGLYFKYDESKQMTDMAAAIPVKEEVAIQDALSYHIDERKALTIDYYGDYKDIGPAHYAIDAYMKDRNILNDAPVVEEYVTDPANEPDPTKWLTKIFYYIAE